MSVRVCAGLCAVLFLFTSHATAQDAPAAAWKYNVGGGFSFTSGNKDTSTYNASYTVNYRAGERRTFKSDALLLRGRTNGELSHDRFGLNLREEVRVNEQFFVFGQNQYLRDRFKRIQYLVAPTAGLGFTSVSTDTTTLTFDAGAGGVWEKNPYRDVRASGALTFSQKLTQAISSSTTLTQSVSGLWKTEDLADAIYQLGVALTLGINSRIQFKIEALDSYNTRPTGSMVQKNDVSTVFAIVVKN